LFLAPSAPVGPVQDVPDVVPGGQDEAGEQTTDLVAAQRDQAAVAVAGAPFSASLMRVTTRNAAAAIARVIWAYQAS
jgi:hypothetical protein